MFQPKKNGCFLSYLCYDFFQNWEPDCFLFFVTLAYIDKHTHTQHSDDSPLMQTDNEKKENCTLQYVVCLTPTHVWPTCYLSSSRVENIPPTDSFMITSQHFETHGQEQKDMAIKPSCCLLSHSEI